MSFPTIYKCKTATFDSIPLSGLIDCTVQKSANKTKTRADAALAFTGIFGEGMGRQVTLRFESNGNYAQLVPAMIGSLVVNVGEQQDGSGLSGAGASVLQFPASSSTGAAYLDTISEGIPFEGKPTVALSFDVYDGAGDPSLLEELT
jgi:hypothetical protein